MSDIISRSFKFQNAENIHFSALGNVRIIQGDEEESILVEGSQEALEHIKFEQEGSHVHIRLYTWYDFLFVPLPASYTIKVKKLYSFSISGSAEMVADTLTTPRLDLSISGSGRMRIGEVNVAEIQATSSGSGNFDLAKITAQEVKTSLSGSGNFRLDGTAEKLSVRVSGSGEVDGSQLAVRREEIHISGAARIVCQVSDDLDVHISGAGEILYQGAPKIRQSISGSGTIRQQ